MNRISRIMARFLPLMDLSMLLLGCFMIILTAVKFDVPISNKEKETASIIARSVVEHTSVMLYVACQDEGNRKNGEIYPLDKDYNIGEKAINQTSPDDINAIIEEILPKNRKREDVVVFVVSPKLAWDQNIPRDLCLKLQESWHLPRVYRVKNVELPDTSVEVK